ncbi:MAG: hypothetical protein AAGI48_03800 [Verrucomicrobiota bacterium]
MSNDTKKEKAPAAGADSAAKGRTAQVHVLKHKLVIGNLKYPLDAVVDDVPIDDAEYKEEKGFLKILNVKGG